MVYMQQWPASLPFLPLKYFVDNIKQFFPKYVFSFNKVDADNMEQNRIDNMEDEIEKIVTCHYNNKKTISMNDDDLYISIFFNELRFFSVYSFNDAVTFSKDYLEQRSKIEELFRLLSNKSVFRSIPEIHKYNKEGSFVASLPNWIRSNPSSIGKVLVALFEQTITIRYIIYTFTYKNDMNLLSSNILFSDKLIELETRKKALIKYLSNEYSTIKVDKLIEEIKLRDIHRLLLTEHKIMNKVKLRFIQIESFKSYTSRLFPYEPKIFNNNYDLTQRSFKFTYTNLSLSQFLDNLIYFDPSRISKLI